MSNGSSPKKSAFSNDSGDDAELNTGHLHSRIDWGRAIDLSIEGSSVGSPQGFDWKNLTLLCSREGCVPCSNLSSSIDWNGHAILESKERLTDLLPRVDSGVQNLLQHAESKQFALGKSFVKDAAQELGKKKDEAFAAMATATRSGIPPSDPEFARARQLELELDRYMSEAVRLHNLAKRYNAEMNKWRVRVQEIQAEKSDLLDNYKLSRRQNKLFDAVARPDAQPTVQSRASKSLSPKKTSNQLAIVAPQPPITPRAGQGSPRPPQAPNQIPFLNSQRGLVENQLRSTLTHAVALVPLSPARSEEFPSVRKEGPCTSKDDILKQFGVKGLSDTSMPMTGQVDVESLPSVSPKSGRKNLSFAPQLSIEEDARRVKPHQASDGDKDEESLSSSPEKVAIRLEIDDHILQRSGSLYFTKHKEESNNEETESNLSWLDQRLNSGRRLDQPRWLRTQIEEPVQITAERKEKIYLAEISDLEEKLRCAKMDIDTLRLRSAKVFAEKSWVEEFFLLCMTDLRRHIQKHQSIIPKQRSGRATVEGCGDCRPADGRQYNEVCSLLLNSDDAVALLYEQMFPHRAAFFNAKQRSCCHNKHRTLLPFLKQNAQGVEDSLPPNNREVETYLGL